MECEDFDQARCLCFINSVSENHWDMTAKLTASDGGGLAAFGTSVSVSGNKAIVKGSYYDKGEYLGSACVFEKDDSTGHWNEVAKLTASDGVGGDNFGWSVSISGDTAIVGAPGDDPSGSAYIFEKNSSGYWNETAKLTLSNGNGAKLDQLDHVRKTRGGVLNPSIGGTVSISGNGAIVGSDAGSAYVFEKDDSTGDWNKMVELEASDRVKYDDFGDSVSVSGNIAIIGAPRGGDGCFRSAAYVFEKDDLNGAWNEMAKLTASDGAAAVWFGYSVSVSGNIAVVAHYGSRDSPFHEKSFGAAYVFERDDLTGYWNETAKLTASDGEVDDSFGYSVSVSGNIAIVGARTDDDKGPLSGSVYVFEKNEITGYWNQTTKFTSPEGNVLHGHYFGRSVSISGHSAFVGSSNLKSAYVIETSQTCS